MPALHPDRSIKQEARMNYFNAEHILPDELVKQLQQYVQGDYLYVPVAQGRQTRWGERSGCRQELQRRNAEIRAAYRSGVSTETLAKQYCLSLHAIRKIIYQK